MLINQVVKSLFPRWHMEKRKRSESGQGLVEFAILLPILLLIMAAIVDLGIMYITAQTIKHASREGARFAVKLEDLEVNPDPILGLGPGDERVSAYVVTHIPDTNLYSSFTGLTALFPGCNAGSEVTITISGEYKFLALNLIGLDTIPLNLSTTMRYELCG